MSNYKTYIFLTALLCCPGLSQAQNPSQGQEKKQGIQFSCMLWNGPLPEKIYYQDGKDYREVVPYTSSRSLPHWLEKSKEFRLFTRKEVDQVDGKEAKLVYSLVGQSKLMGDISPVLFILFPTSDEQGLKIRILALDDSLNGFPPGSFRFANFSVNLQAASALLTFL
jgi:hypothetical protein